MLRRHCIDCRVIIDSGSYCKACLPAHELPAGWAVVSRRIIARDGICMLRLDGCTLKATTADHIVPRSEGGDDSDANLQGSCLHCNDVKSNMRVRVAPVPRVGRALSRSDVRRAWPRVAPTRNRVAPQEGRGPSIG
jgi:hypothetical protein